jgi:hypothetical protein
MSAEVVTIRAKSVKFMNLGVEKLQMIFAATASSSSAFAALIWWVVPFFAVLGAIIYVTWVAKFKDKYANETNRSVTKFQSFQDSFRDDSTPNS